MSIAVDQASNPNDDIAKILNSYVEDYFPTSSSLFCIIAKNDKIMFYKDQNTTANLSDSSVENYLNHDVVVINNNSFLLSKSVAEYNNDQYSLIICTRQDYYLKKIKLTEIRLYCMGFFFLYGTMLSVILIYIFYKLRAEEKGNTILVNEVHKDRLLIELLEDDKKKHYANSEKEYSFYSRYIAEEVIANMTREEKKKCVQIDIIVENSKMEHFIFITAILARIKGTNSIAYYREKNQFKVLLLNSNKEEALEFINLFISKYKAESEEKVEELKVIASRLK
jgi:hypothetical protein